MVAGWYMSQKLVAAKVDAKTAGVGGVVPMDVGSLAGGNGGKGGAPKQKFEGACHECGKRDTRQPTAGTEKVRAKKVRRKARPEFVMPPGPPVGSSPAGRA